MTCSATSTRTTWPAAGRSIGTLEERLDEAVARRVKAFESAPGPQLNPDNPQN